MNRKTGYERFESSSDENRRLLRQEELILDATIALCEEIEKAQVSKSEIAKRLGKTPGFVTQVLSGGRNLTLRTMADMADAIDAKVCIHVRGNQAMSIVIPMEREAMSGWEWDRRDALPIRGPENLKLSQEGAAV